MHERFQSFGAHILTLSLRRSIPYPLNPARLDFFNRSLNPATTTAAVQETLGTIWKVPDELWEIIEPIILKEDPPKTRGRKRACPRRMLNGIIFRLRSGCQWNRLPKELGDDSTIHRTFQRWVDLGVLHRMWGVLVEGCEELGHVDWEWQSADAAMGKARFGGT